MRCQYTGGYCPYEGIGIGCVNPGACPEVQCQEESCGDNQKENEEE